MSDRKQQFNNCNVDSVKVPENKDEKYCPRWEVNKLFECFSKSKRN